MKFAIITVVAVVMISLAGCSVPVSPLMFLVDDGQSQTGGSHSVSDV